MIKDYKFKQLSKFGYYGMWICMSFFYIILIVLYVAFDEIHANLIYQILDVIVLFIFPSSFLLYCTNHIFLTVFMSKEGLTVRGLFHKTLKRFSWEEIIDVGFGMEPQFNGTKNIFLYFAVRKLQDYEIMKIFSQKDNKDVIIISYDPKVYDAAKLFYPKEFRFEKYKDQIDDLSFWQR